MNKGRKEGRKEGRCVNFVSAVTQGQSERAAERERGGIEKEGEGEREIERRRRREREREREEREEGDRE